MARVFSTSSSAVHTSVQQTAAVLHLPRVSYAYTSTLASMAFGIVNLMGTISMQANTRALDVGGVVQLHIIEAVLRTSVCPYSFTL